MSFPVASFESFSIKRTFNHNVENVFKAWTDSEAKSKWFVGPGNWKLVNRSLDFRVGGEEVLQGNYDGRMETLFTAHYHEIITNFRIVYDYVMTLNQAIHSVSLSTVEFFEKEEGSEMIYNEQITFLDGTKGEKGRLSRIHGTEAHFDRFEKFLD